MDNYDRLFNTFYTLCFRTPALFVIKKIYMFSAKSISKVILQFVLNQKMRKPSNWSLSL